MWGYIVARVGSVCPPPPALETTLAILSPSWGHMLDLLRRSCDRLLVPPWNRRGPILEHPNTMLAYLGPSLHTALRNDLATPPAL
eukprot:3637156-Pyramimonas_sp.AAC.1